MLATIPSAPRFTTLSEWPLVPLKLVELFTPPTRTIQNCLVLFVRVGGVNTIGDKTKLSCLICSCVHTADANKTKQAIIVIHNEQLLNSYLLTS